MMTIFYVLDFDRCIGDTAKFHDVLESVVADLTTISREELAQVKRDTELSGGSFNTEAYVTAKLRAQQSSVSWPDIRTAMLKRARQQDMLEPHAADLLRILNERSEYYGILTHGGVEWQKAKIEGANLAHVPYVVTSQRDKGLTISGWQQTDGSFLIPEELAGAPNLLVKEVVLVDDKAVSFANLPLGARGYHVVWSDRELLASQVGAIPANVTVAHGMIGVIELLFEQQSVKSVDKT